MPNEGSPGVAGADTSDHHADNVSRAVRYAAGWHANDGSDAHPHPVCDDPESSGNTIGTSRADRLDRSNLSLAR